MRGLSEIFVYRFCTDLFVKKFMKCNDSDIFSFFVKPIKCGLP